MAESALAYLSAVTMSAAMVAGSERMSLCLRRVPSRHPLTKYWIAWTSWTPLQLFRSSVQRARYTRPVSVGPCTHKESWRGFGGRLYVLVKLRMKTSVKSSQLLTL